MAHIFLKNCRAKFMRVFEVYNRLCNLTPESHPNNVLSFEVGEKKKARLYDNSLIGEILP